MKKIILVAAALFITVISFGQAKTGFSASLGWDIEPYNYGGAEVNPSSLSGIFVRGDYEYAFTKHSGVSAGLRFDYIGLGDYAKLQTVKTTWKKAYIDIPIKYNAHFGGFYLNAGPVVKFLISYKHTDTDEESGSSVTINDLKDYPDTFNKVYFGLGGGLGYTFNAGIKIFVDYDYNFTNVVKEGKKDLPSTSKPSVITIGVGYNF